MLLRTSPAAQSFMLMTICYEDNNTGSFARALMQFLYFSRINARSHPLCGKLFCMFYFSVESLQHHYTCSRKHATLL